MITFQHRTEGGKGWRRAPGGKDFLLIYIIDISNSNIKYTFQSKVRHTLISLYAYYFLTLFFYSCLVRSILGRSIVVPGGHVDRSGLIDFLLVSLSFFLCTDFGSISDFALIYN